MKARHLVIALVIVIAVLVTGCGQTTPTPSSNPAWVDQLIEQFKAAPVGNPPQAIWRYDFQGQVVYFVPAQCCDMYSTLYDAAGNVLCAPDGGIAGRGDEQCPDFTKQRTNATLIWQDPRER